MNIRGGDRNSRLTMLNQIKTFIFSKVCNLPARLTLSIGVIRYVVIV